MKLDDPVYNTETKLYYHSNNGPICNGTFREWNGLLYYKDGKPHREDGPAKDYDNGSKYWFLEGKIVYSISENYLHLYDNLSDAFKKSIIKYVLSK
jgi:hypothetical protein